MAEEYECRTYEDLSDELQKIYPIAARAFELIPLMYNRLTLVDGLTHKIAFEKIVADHQHLSGFSERNIRRYLPIENPTVPKRVRPPCPKNSITETNNLSQLSEAEQENNNEIEQHTSSENQKNLIDFEFSLPWEDVHQYIRADGSFAEVWFNGRIEIRTGKVITASIGSISDNT